MKTKTSILFSLLLLAAALPARAETETVDGVEWTYQVENGFALLGGGTESTPAVPVATCEVTFRKRLTTVEAEATSIDLRPDPRKVDPGAGERLTFGSRWAGSAAEAAAVEIALDGTRYLTLPGGEGTFDWTPERGGLFTFTHTALDANGRALGVPYQASFLVDMSDVIPHDVTASDGTSEDCVEVSWEAVSGAVHEVWRGASDGAFADAVKLGETEEGEWNDETAVPGVVYRYWVRALFGGVTSAPSDPDTGWRAIPNMFVGVTKEWDDNENEAGYRPESVRFTLVADGVDIATTNLSDSVGWTAIWTVPKYADGVGIDYSVREDNLPDAYDALVATNGCGMFKNVPFNSNVLTEYGWVQFNHAKFNSNIWTEYGWVQFKHAKFNNVVMTDYRGLGTMFCFTNRYMRPTRKTELAVSGWSGVYDGEPHGVEVTSASVGASFLYATSEHGPYTAEKPTWREAGPSHETWVIAEARFFAPVTNKVTVTISPRPLAVTAAAKSKVYGEADPALTYTATGLVAGDAISGAPARAPGENVGTYAIGQGTLTAGPNYELAFAGADFTITPAKVTIRADAKTKVFGTADPALTYTVEGLAPGDDESSVEAVLLRAPGEAVGSYDIFADDVFFDSNYTYEFVGAQLTITKGMIPDIEKIRWGGSGEGARFLYDGAKHSVALTGLPAGVTATYERNAATDAGDYIATAHLVYDTANYETVPDPAPLAWGIDRRPITLMAASKEKPYDGWPLEVKAEDVTASGSGYAPGECFTYGDYASITDVGEIPATFSYADSATAKVSNYDVTVKSGQTLKITVGGDQISVTADSGAWPYDGQTHRLPSWTVFNGDKLLDGHAFDIAICTNSAVTTPAEGIVSNAFDHVRIVDAEGLDRTRNYNLLVYEGTLQVTNAAIGPYIAPNVARHLTYDGQAHSAAVEAPALLQPAAVRYRVGEGEWTAEAPAWTHAGTYAAQFEVSAPFYDSATGVVTVAISPRPAVVRAIDTSKVFGDADPALAWESDDLLEGDTLAGAPARDPGEDVREYAIRIGTLANANYALSFEEGVFEILPGGIVVDASAGALGYAGEYDGAAHAPALRVKNPATGATVQWAMSTSGPWQAAAPTFVDAGTNTVWWRVAAPNFKAVSGTAAVSIAPRPISKATVGALTNEYYTGYAVEPVPSVTDTVPITAEDWSLSWEGNVEVGTARAIVTGSRNYCGEVVREFGIVLKPVIVIVIDLSNVEVGQGKWGSAALLTNSVPVPEVLPGARTELEVPSGTDIDLTFVPDAGFRIGSVIVDGRIWSTNTGWRYESAKADKSFAASYLPDPRTKVVWKYGGKSVNRYYAQLSFPVYPGYDEALSDLKFLFADRIQGDEVYAQLWDTPKRTAVANILEQDGKEYRYVSLDASKMAGVAAGKRVAWGVSDATLASSADSVPSAERTIGLYIRKRISPVSGKEEEGGVENFLAAFSWETNGKTYYQPVGEGYANGIVAEKILDAEDLDAAEALGFDPAFLATAEAKCRFTAFSPDDGMDGWFEVYAEQPDGIEAVSSGTTENAIFRLWGKAALDDEWTALPRATFPEKDGGAVRFRESTTDLGPSQFFGVSIEVRATHE